MAGSATGGGREATVDPPRHNERRDIPWPLIGVVTATAACVLATYAVLAAAGILVRPGAEGVPWHAGHLAFAVVMFTVAQLARIFHRVRGEAIMLAWGEVGVIAALCLVPGYWLPIVAAVGALLGHGPRLLRSSMPARARVLFTVCVLTIGASASASVVALLADPRVPLRATLADPWPLLPLGLAAAAYYLCTSLLSAAWPAVTSGLSIFLPWRSAARTKRVMLAIAVPMGVAITFAAGVDPMLVAAVVPSLWLVHQVYAHHVTSTEDHRIWTTLAEATRSLHQLDEPAVARAALRGAVAIFGPAKAELSWRSPSGQTQRYRVRGAEPDRIDEAGPGDPGEADPDAVAATTVLVRRPLLIGGAQRGELALGFRHPLPLRPVDQMAFATFADAVASALQDAATHRRLQELTARGAYEAIHDRLTGLSNRSSLLAGGNAQLRRGPADRPVALIVVGLDGFHAITETLGHSAGDDLLRLLAGRLAGRCGQGEQLGRTAENEFALLIDDSGGPGEPVDRAAALVAFLAEPAVAGGVTITVQPCAGVVRTTAGDCDMAELLRRAEVALHQARGSGTRVASYDPGTDAAGNKRLALLADVRDALATTDQFGLALQPTVNMATGAVVSVEALARWRHPARGQLPPDEFIPVIDHSDLATGFTLHMVDMALGVAAAWAETGIATPVSVNLCSRCVANVDLPDLVAALLERHALPADRLTLEMSESVVEGEEDRVRGVIAAVREHGVRISVDDFGTGSASLAFLTRFHVDEVKIDRSFVATMAESPETAAIVRTTVDLGRSLGLRVVAEGVERSDQRAALMDLGVTLAQGFLFHRPLSVADATEVLRA